MLINMATASVDEWTEEKCLQLIREYRSKPILWDQKDAFYFKKSMKPVIWKQIGAVLGIDADVCKHKMNILMSSFRREKARITHSINEFKDTSQVYKSSWFGFKEMAFLLDKDSERKRQLNDSDSDVDEDDGSRDNIKITLLKHHVDKPVSAVKRVRSSLSVKKDSTKKAVHKAREESVVTIQQPIPGPSQAPTERDEEIKSFTSFIGNKMKKYSDTTKNSVQQAICDIIFKADQNYYENNSSNSYENFTIIQSETDPLNKHTFEDGGTIIKMNDSDSD